MPADYSGVDVVVFDVDDTLYLERDYVASGFAAMEQLVAAGFGVSGFQGVAWRLFVDGHRGDIFDRALTKLGIQHSSDDVKDLVQAYRRHRPRIDLLPDARHALDDLRALGRGIAVLTDGPRESQSAKVRALGLGRYAEAIVITDEFGPGFTKPNTDGFAHIANMTRGRTFTYVADNPRKDFAGPKALGWTTIRVRRPDGLHAAVAGDVDIDRTLNDLTHVVSVLGGTPISVELVALKSCNRRG